MKFQPSKMSVTPIQGYSNAYYSSNKFIPSSSVLDLERNDEADEEKDIEIHSDEDDEYEYDDDDDDDDKCRNLGRVLRYDTVTITSPVLASARLVHRTAQQPQRYINDHDVNELNNKLQSLLLNTRKDEKNDDDNEDDDDDEDDMKINHQCGGGGTGTKYKTNGPSLVVGLTPRDQATTTYFGRCRLMVYNSMTHNFVEVIRSARLALTSSPSSSTSSSSSV